MACHRVPALNDYVRNMPLHTTVAHACEVVLTLRASRRSFRAALLAIFFCAALISSNAQGPTPAIPDNALSTTSPIGTPPNVPTDGASESVNLTNGALTTYVPIVSVPQRGGWSLPLAFIHSSNALSLQLNSSTTSGEIPQDDDRFEVVFKYTPQMAWNWGTFQLNIPQLKANLEYSAPYLWYSTINGQQVITGILANYCETNFVFTDWQGSSHPFAITYDCNNDAQEHAPFYKSTVGDAIDGSFYRIDFSNSSYIQIIAKDGTTYRFPPPTPVSQLNSPQVSGNNIVNYYTGSMTAMFDNNGNVVSFSNGTLTDTLGRTYTISNPTSDSTSVTYKGSNGNSQTVTLALTTPTSATDPKASVSCMLNNGDQNGRPPYGTACVNPTPDPNYMYFANATITYPASDANGNSKVLTLLSG